MKKTLIISLIVAALAVGCSDNYRAKNTGGSITVTLPAGQKLVTATWKDQGLWYLHRPMRSNEVAETSILKEKSTYGVWEGSVTFTESK